MLIPVATPSSCVHLSSTSCWGAPAPSPGQGSRPGPNSHHWGPLPPAQGALEQSPAPGAGAPALRVAETCDQREAHALPTTLLSSEVFPRSFLVLSQSPSPGTGHGLFHLPEGVHVP